MHLPEKNRPVHRNGTLAVQQGLGCNDATDRALVQARKETNWAPGAKV